METTLCYTIARDSMPLLSADECDAFAGFLAHALSSAFGDGCDVRVGVGDERSVSGSALDEPGAYETARDTAATAWDSWCSRWTARGPV